jgi:tRNA 2-thiouridine synthesizing protein B
VILHTLNASPSSPAFDDCLRVAQSGDALVLLGDGVYAALEGTEALRTIQASGTELYLLHQDAAAAGIIGAATGVTSITMDELVALTERFPRQQAWY